MKSPMITRPTQSAEQQSPKYNCEHVQDLSKCRYGVRFLRGDAGGKFYQADLAAKPLKMHEVH